MCGRPDSQAFTYQQTHIYVDICVACPSKMCVFILSFQCDYIDWMISNFEKLHRLVTTALTRCVQALFCFESFFFSNLIYGFWLMNRIRQTIFGCFQSCLIVCCCRGQCDFFLFFFWHSQMKTWQEKYLQKQCQNTNPKQQWAKWS